MTTAAAICAQLAAGHLLALSWRNGGQDVELQLERPDGGCLRVLCTAVTGLDVDLHYRKHASGLPRAFDVEMERTLGGRWSLHWSFPPHGVIALECADVKLLGAAVA